MKAQQTINPLEGEKNKQPELERRISTTENKTVQELFKYYMKLSEPGFLETFHAGRPLDIYCDLESKVLTPAQLSLMLQAMIQARPKRTTESFGGLFITKQIQASYDAGNNNFIVQLGDLEIDCLGYRLKAEEKRPLVLSIRGNAGGDLADCAEYCEFHISGSVKTCGTHISYCKFYIEQDINQIVSPVRHCFFEIKGNAGTISGAESEFILHGDVEKIDTLYGASTGTTFSIMKPEVFKKLSKEHTIIKNAKYTP